MKRLIDGVTYNTDTATRLARSEYEGDWNHEECHIECELYQTRGGSFFHVEHITIGKDEDGDDIVKHRFSKCSEKSACEWINTGEVEVFLNPFEEKVAEDETLGTVYVRMPASLKRQIEAVAETNGLSANSWAMRCFEKCLAESARSTIQV